MIIGDDNRNTLVGNGANDIIAGHGGGDDVVGTTAFDNSTTNLRTLPGQWTTTVSTFERLLPSGLTGVNKLFHDNFTDRLTGSTGSDYFFTVRTGRFADDITDRMSAEILAS